MEKELENWWKQAEADLESAKEIIGIKRYYVASGLCQQAVEKALKCLLLSRGWKLKKIHDLVKLAQEAGLPPNLVDCCDSLNPVYIESRYPDTGEVPPYQKYTEKESEADAKAAEEVILWIKKKL